MRSDKVLANSLRLFLGNALVYSTLSPFNLFCNEQCHSTLHSQSQAFIGVTKNCFSEKIRKVHRKATLKNLILSKVVGLGTCRRNYSNKSTDFLEFPDQ